jgi:hypothetical protein
MRGVGHRHERAVRCDGRRWRDRRSRPTRTVKSCGSGAAVLASSLREGAQATEAKQPFSGKSTKQAVNPLRREGRDASAEPVCSCASFAKAQTARGTAGAARTRSSLRPLIGEGKRDANLGHIMSRDRDTISRSLRAQRSNPSFRVRRTMDCFAPLAKTRRERSTIVAGQLQRGLQRPACRSAHAGYKPCTTHTGSAIEYFTWLSAKLDSIEAMPSSRVSLFFRNAS